MIEVGAAQREALNKRLTIRRCLSTFITIERVSVYFVPLTTLSLVIRYGSYRVANSELITATKELARSDSEITEPHLSPINIRVFFIISVCEN